VPSLDIQDRTITSAAAHGAMPPIPAPPPVPTVPTTNVPEGNTATPTCPVLHPGTTTYHRAINLPTYPVHPPYTPSTAEHPRKMPQTNVGNPVETMTTAAPDNPAGRRLRPVRIRIISVPITSFAVTIFAMPRLIVDFLVRAGSMRSVRRV